MKISGQIVFGDSVIPNSQIFLLRKNVFAIINHKPVAPGHVLVCARRQAAKLQELTQIETIDLFMTAHEVCRKLAQIYKIQYQIYCQNGKQAGQNINHVHLHLIPVQKSSESVLQRKQDKVRNEQDMTRQADRYRSCFQQGFTG